MSNTSSILTYLNLHFRRIGFYFSHANYVDVGAMFFVSCVIRISDWCSGEWTESSSELWNE